VDLRELQTAFLKRLAGELKVERSGLARDPLLRVARDAGLVGTDVATPLALRS